MTQAKRNAAFKRMGGKRDLNSVERILCDNAGVPKFTLFFSEKSVFSNFYPAIFKIGDIQFVNTEQYFHFKKAELFADERMKTAILNATKGREHKKYGRQVANFVADTWSKNCRRVMTEGNLAKFQQNPDLLKRLFETQNTELVEANPRDRIWGIGRSISDPLCGDKSQWRGQNLLGQILNDVRKQLSQEDTMLPASIVPKNS